MRTPSAVRVRWYLRALGRNPLVRGSDRLEALAVLAVFVIGLFAVPFAAQAQDQTFDAGMRTVAHEERSRHSVEAVVVEGSTVMLSDFDSPAYVRAQWRDGPQPRTELIVAPTLLKVGDSVEIWLDDTGKVVTAPLTAADAKATAVAAAWTVWFAVVLCAALAALGVRGGLNRYRAHGWERELQLLAHNDDGWANRRT